MKLAPELIPVIQITLPIVVAIFGAAWVQNKRLDDIIGRLGRIEDRLLAIETRLAGVERKVDALELKAWR